MFTETINGFVDERQWKIWKLNCTIRTCYSVMMVEKKRYLHKLIDNKILEDVLTIL